MSVTMQETIEQGNELLTETEQRFLALFSEADPSLRAQLQERVSSVISLLHSARAVWQGTSPAPADPALMSQRSAVLNALWQQEQVRARIARALQNDLGQLLANAAAELSACMMLLEVDTDSARAGLKALEQELRQGLDGLRWLVAELVPPSLLTKLGLAAGLRQYTNQLSTHFNLEVDLDLEEPSVRLPQTMELIMFRIAQEALRNAQQHAQATRIRLVLKPVEEGWMLRIEDNGQGFTGNQIGHARGLIVMREWAQLLDGHLQVESVPGQGTSITLIAPTDPGSHCSFSPFPTSGE